jgi:cell wall-associated NlpC family hydrolase
VTIAGVAQWSAAADAATRPEEVASMWLGARYRHGGSAPDTGFDCSGLVAHAFQRARGIALPRNAHAQSKMGVPVKPSALEPGDLVFYNTRNRPYSHVGIYLGEGRFIHAPRPGTRVRVESMQVAYWRARFNGARRVEAPGA